LPRARRAQLIEATISGFIVGVLAPPRRSAVTSTAVAPARSGTATVAVPAEVASNSAEVGCAWPPRLIQTS
jgi:hypothetical protein